jgi:hypothetical protein
MYTKASQSKFASLTNLQQHSADTPHAAVNNQCC